MAGSREVIKELFVLLGVEADMKDFDRAAEAIDDLIGLSKKLVVGMTAATGVIVAAQIHTTRYGDSAAKTARQLGLTAEEVQLLTFAAKRGGASFEQLRTGMAKVQQRAAEAARGNKEYRKEFRLLGVDVRNADGSLKGGLDLLTEVAAAIGKIPDAGERARVAMRLFEEGGIQLLPFLTKMADELPTLRKRWVELGGGLSNEAAASAEKAADAMLDLEVASLGVVRRLGTSLLPTQARVVRGMANWLVTNRELVDSLVNKLAGAVRFAVMKVEQYLVPLLKVVATKRVLKGILGALSLAFGISFVSSLGAAVKGIGMVLVALKGLQKGIILTKLIAFGEFAIIGALLVGLALMIEDVVTALMGGDSLFGRFVKKFSSAPSGDEWWITRQVRAAYAPIRLLSQMVVRFLQLFSGNDASVQAAKNYWMRFWDDIVENWRDKLGAIGETILATLKLNPLTAPSGFAIDATHRAVGSASDAVGAAASSVGNRISQATNSLSAKINVSIDGASGDPVDIANRTADAIEQKLRQAARNMTLELNP